MNLGFACLNTIILHFCRCTCRLSHLYSPISYQDMVNNSNNIPPTQDAVMKSTFRKKGKGAVFAILVGMITSAVNVVFIQLWIVLYFILFGSGPLSSMGVLLDFILGALFFICTTMFALTRIFIKDNIFHVILGFWTMNLIAAVVTKSTPKEHMYNLFGMKRVDDTVEISILIIKAGIILLLMFVTKMLGYHKVISRANNVKCESKVETADPFAYAWIV
jgi:hypothetical protein